MKTTSGDETADLTTLTTCWLIARTDGVTFALTEHDQPLTVNGVTYEPGASYQATAIRTASEMKLDTLDAEGVFDSDAITDADLQAGKFDGAAITIITANWLTGVKNATLRRGTLGPVVRSQNGYKAELRGLTRALQTIVGDVYQPNCRADLGDSKCTVNLVPLAQTGTVTSVTDGWTFTASGITGAPARTLSYTADTISFVEPDKILDSANGFLTSPHSFVRDDAITITGSARNDTQHGIEAVSAGQLTTASEVFAESAGANITLSCATPSYFDFGKITWLTGNNATLQREVRDWDGTSKLDLLLPMALPIQVGDTFSITPGCDLRAVTCVSKFNNILNFRGEPFVPGEDAALAYPNAR